ncbi:MAG: hypothetical protein MRY32_04220 [Rickettsiales bacterium]|nr:hypothetical protein [Rickettsiales bacterium]
MSVQDLAKIFEKFSTPQIQYGAPVEREGLENALRASMAGPDEHIITNELNQEIRREPANKVTWFNFKEEKNKRGEKIEYVSIATTAGAKFDLPLHLDREQVTNMLNMEYNLDIELPEILSFEDDLDSMKVQDIRAAGKELGLTFPVGTTAEDMKVAIREKQKEL